RYIRQVYPVQVIFDEGVFVTYDRSDIHPLAGLTGLFLQSERGGSVSALARAILNFLLLSDLSAVVACAECYAFPEPDYYTLGLSPIRDSFGAGLGWPPLHFYFEVPIVSWFTDATRIAVLRLGCNVAWPKISDRNCAGRGS